MYNNVEIDTNFVTSYYGRYGFDKFVENNVASNSFLYINEEKATALSAESNTSWFEQLKGYDFNTIIRKSRINVKENIAESTDGNLHHSKEMKTVADLKAQNRYLEEKVKHLKNQMELSKGKTVRKDDVRKYARALREIVLWTSGGAASYGTPKAAARA